MKNTQKPTAANPAANKNANFHVATANTQSNSDVKKMLTAITATALALLCLFTACTATPAVPQQQSVPTQQVTLQQDVWTPPASELALYDAAVAKTALNVRAEPDATSAKTGRINAGQALPLIEKCGDWYKVDYQGKTGYISASYAGLVQTSAVTERVIAVGMAKLGTPYQWGATRMFSAEGKRIGSFTGNTFDCSSFVQYCFYSGAGVILGDYTGSQATYTVGKKIYNYDELRRGDIVFTGTNGKISHVIIYLGQNLLLHAYSANGGPVSVTEDGRWRGKFISARRVDVNVKSQYC